MYSSSKASVEIDLALAQMHVLLFVQAVEKYADEGSFAAWTALKDLVDEYRQNHPT